MKDVNNSVDPSKKDLIDSIWDRAKDPRQPSENLAIANDVLYIASNNVLDRMNKFLEHYPKLKKLIDSQLIINCDKEFFYSAVDNIVQLPTLDSYLNSPDKDIYKVILNYTVFTDEFTKKLQNDEFKNKWLSCLKDIDAIVWPEHGEHEILLNFFINGGQLIPGCDIYVNGTRIEAKKNFGMLKGAQTPPHPIKIIDTLKNYLKDDTDVSTLEDICLGGPQLIKSSINSLLSNSKLTIQEITYYFCIGYFSQYFDLSNAIQFNMFLNHITFSYDDIKKLCKEIYNIHGLLSIINYQLTDKWDYLFICDNESGKYEVIKSAGVDNILKVSWKYYFNLFNNENITYAGGPRARANDSDVRHYCAGIKLV